MSARTALCTGRVLYTLNGKQTSSSFNDPQEAVEFQTLANKTSPTKALEVWAAKGVAPNVHSVGSWCLHHVDHLTGVNQATRTKYRSYVANDMHRAR